jgi:ABC-type multidrug transport system fused ATPase/permease subunit
MGRNFLLGEIDLLMEAVVVQDLTYRYQPGGHLVLKDIGFHVSRGGCK